MKPVFLKVHGGSPVLGYTSGIMSIRAPSPHPNEPGLLSGSSVAKKRPSNFYFNFFLTVQQDLAFYSILA